MRNMNGEIQKFINKQTCATICTTDDDGKPYCFNVFYAFDIEKALLYFKTADDTKHAPLIKANPNIAGTILPDKLNLLAIKGVQFEGLVFADAQINGIAATAYYAKHPVARVVPGNIWIVSIEHIKFTDNTFGFGEKLEWSRNIYEEKSIK